MKLHVLRLDPDLSMPAYAHPGDAGLDLLARADVDIGPKQRAAIATGIAVAIPEGHAGFVHARSGRALKDGLALVNAPGVVDAGYRGEVMVLAVNLDPREPIHIRRGEKIAQLIIQEVRRAEIEEATELPASVRGQEGFGSTGR